MGNAGLIQSITGTLTSSYDARQQSYVAAAKQRLATQAAADARERGREDVGTIRREGNRVVGGIRAGVSHTKGGAQLALGLASGVPLELQVDTARQTELDVLTARNNAAREAWGFDVQAGLYNFQRKNLKDKGSFLGLKTLIKSTPIT